METISTLGTLRTVDPLNGEWVTVVLLVTVFLLALINVSSPRKWRLLGRSMFSLRLGKQALREEMDLQDRAFLGLLFIGSTVLALFSWQTMTVHGHAPAFPSLLFIVVLVFLAHYLLLRLVGVFMRNTPGVEEYLYTGFLIFILSGVVLLPLVVVMAYQPGLRPAGIFAGALLMSVLLLYRWFRGAWIGLGEGLPLRYIILYFCAAELLPVLLAIDHWRSIPSPLFHS
jgi:hypothetical protein